MDVFLYRARNVICLLSMLLGSRESRRTSLGGGDWKPQIWLWSVRLIVWACKVILKDDNLDSNVCRTSWHRSIGIWNGNLGTNKRCLKFCAQFQTLDFRMTSYYTEPNRFIASAMQGLVAATWISTASVRRLCLINKHHHMQALYGVSENW